MSVNDAPEILKLGQARIFIQDAGSSPANPYNYLGQLSLDGLQQSLGDENPVYLPSSEQHNHWDIVDTIPTVPTLPTTDFTQRANKYLSDIWWDLRKRQCKFNAFVNLGTCQRPDDPDGFDARITLVGNRLTAFNPFGTLNPLSGDDNAAADITGSLTLTRFEPFKPLTIGEVADAILLAEALDGLWSDAVSCGDCGTPSDGCQRAYVLALANSGSPGLSSQIVHTKNGWSTATALDIPTLGGLSGSRVAMVGNKLVVISQANNAHHYITQANVDADNAAGWTRNNSGYVATKGPRCIWSKASTETFIGASGGYIYKMTSPSAAVLTLSAGDQTTQDFNDIHGLGQTIVLVGNSNALIYSSNGGDSFASKTGPAVGVALNAIHVISANVWWVGAANGKAYYTVDGGSTWTQTTLDNDVTTIEDIQFVDEIVGYMAVQAGGAGRIYRTGDNGNNWSAASPYITGLPSYERWNFCTPCGKDYNRMLAGGRVSSAGDGAVVIGA
jgi:hypothetical protein